MPSKLERLAGPGQPLAAEAPDKAEFEGLKHSGLTRLADCRLERLSLEGRFDLAYNAAHALCLAALRATGYRPRHRYIVFQVLPQTLGLGPEVWRVLAKCHDIRNRGEYEGDPQITDRLVSDLIKATGKVAEKLVYCPVLIADIRALQMACNKAQAAGHSGSVFKACNAVAGHLRGSLRASRQAAICGVARS